jgi:hypothetical protein
MNLDSTIRWRRLDKINVHIIYNLHFLTAIVPHVCDSWNINKQRKTKKLMQCSITTFPLLSHGSGFFLKREYYYAFIVLKCQKKKL